MRDGPDALPRSWFLFVGALAVVMSVVVAESLLIVNDESPNYLLSVALLGIHVAAFQLILQLAGHPKRFLQAVTASAACGAVGSALTLLLFLALVPALGLDNAGGVHLALQIWLLAVDGHIIARSTEQQLFVGIALVTAIFIAQIAFYSAF